MATDTIRHFFRRATVNGETVSTVILVRFAKEPLCRPDRMRNESGLPLGGLKSPSNPPENF
jgi:hypothetical protein